MKFTMLQWKATHAKIYKQHKLDLVEREKGGRRRERGREGQGKGGTGRGSGSGRGKYDQITL